MMLAVSLCMLHFLIIGAQATPVRKRALVTDSQRDAAAGAVTAPEEGKADVRFVDLDRRPQVVIATLTSMVSLECPVEADKGVGYTVQWLHNDKVIPSKSSRFKRKGYLLRILDLVSSDGGNYSCVIESSRTKLSWTFLLNITSNKVTHAPLISRGPQNVTARVGATVEFDCEVHNSSYGSNIHLQWIKQLSINGSYVDEQGSPYIVILNSTRDLTENPWKLVLHRIDEADEAWYSCVIENEIGVEYKSGYLNVTKSSGPQIVAKSTGIQGTLESQPLMLVIGGAAGLIVLVMVVAVGLFCYCRKKQQLGQVRYQLYPHKVPPVSQPLMQKSTIYPTPPPLPRIPYEPEWEFPRNKLFFLDKLGEGAFGVVHQATAYGIGRVPKASNVAVKMMRENSPPSEQNDFVQELEVMKRVKKMGHHVNIVNFLGCCTQGGPLFVIVEYCKFGNLRDFLESSRDGINGYGKFFPPEDPDWFTKTPGGSKINRKSLISYAFQIARGMDFLSSRKCIHRDLAARNVLVTEDHVLKIADFGLTRTGDYYKKRSGGRLPVKWMAPEALMYQKYTAKSDVWSFGVTLWEIFSLGGMPYASIPHEDLYHKIWTDGYRMPRPELAHDSMYAIMERCWHKDPAHRPDFSQLVAQLDRQLMASLSDEDYLDMTSQCMPSDINDTTG